MTRAKSKVTVILLNCLCVSFTTNRTRVGVSHKNWVLLVAPLEDLYLPDNSLWLTTVAADELQIFHKTDILVPCCCTFFLFFCCWLQCCFIWISVLRLVCVGKCTKPRQRTTVCGREAKAPKWRHWCEHELRICLLFLLLHPMFAIDDSTWFAFAAACLPNSA